MLENFKASQLNYTIFQVGKATLLRVSDVRRLKYQDIYSLDGSIKHNAYIRDKKTDKPNTLYLKPIETDLSEYHQWLIKHSLQSEWLFPSIKRPNHHIFEKQFYKIMAHVDDLLRINYLDTHTMRKTGAY